MLTLKPPLYVLLRHGALLAPFYVDQPVSRTTGFGGVMRHKLVIGSELNRADDITIGQLDFGEQVDWSSIDRTVFALDALRGGEDLLPHNDHNSVFELALKQYHHQEIAKLNALKQYHHQEIADLNSKKGNA